MGLFLLSLESGFCVLCPAKGLSVSSVILLWYLSLSESGGKDKTMMMNMMTGAVAINGGVGVMEVRQPQMVEKAVQDAGHIAADIAENAHITLHELKEKIDAVVEKKLPSFKALMEMKPMAVAQTTVDDASLTVYQNGYEPELPVAEQPVLPVTEKKGPAVSHPRKKPVKKTKKVEETAPSAIEEAACAKELGLDLIVTDHHLPGETLPDAVAVVDPKRADDESPFKDLCGAGVAFKLCAALEGCEPADLLEMYGELVALGTVADVMPLVGENRTLVREGLALLQDTMRPGLQALMENAGVAGKPVTADTVSYSLAPRLNAAGRMDNAAVALKLLLCTDEAQAAGIAARLAEINTERQQTEQEVFAAAQKTLEADPARQRDRVLVVSGEDWHPGVIGIVAARLMEKYNRPAIVISLQNGEGRGSGRAPDPFDLHGALAGCAQYLTRFGGHAAAAGVEIEEEKLPAFRQAINTWAAEHAPRPGAPELKLDAAVQLSELTLPNVQELSRLAPFGRENPMPVLLVCDAMIDGIWPMGAEGRHTRVRLRQGNDTLFASIFGVAPSAFAYPVGTAVEAALEVSIFTGRSGPMVSAHLRAIRPAGLGNLPSEQAAWFEAFRTGGTLEPARAAVLLPDRADTVMLYKRIRGGQVASGDLQPVFAAQGPENTGKTLTSLAALHELGLIQEQNGHWLPVPVTTKQDLASAPILQKLAAVVK